MTYTADEWINQRMAGVGYATRREIEYDRRYHGFTHEEVEVAIRKMGLLEKHRPFGGSVLLLPMPEEEAWVKYLQEKAVTA